MSPIRARSTPSEAHVAPRSADTHGRGSPTMTPGPNTTEGVTLLSHRPSVLYKVEHLATEPVEGDIAVDGLTLAGPGWEERLKELLGSLSQSERACLFALRLADQQGLPLPGPASFSARAPADRKGLPMPAETLLERSRTDWFPEFLSHGQMKPHFQ